MNIIELDNITKSFNGHVAVNDLSLRVPKGSIYGFIGPNGSGKTTTIRMIMNIFYPDNGNIRIFGESQQGSNMKNVGYLPEERGLYKKMKTAELLKFYCQLKMMKNYNQEINYWLEKMELTKWANKKIEALSKGMSQKIQFVATVLNRPEIIILDEPFSGLDPVNTEVIREAILELQASGSTIIFSTHDIDIAEKMCDYIFMIYEGKKVLDGTLNSIKDQYGTDTLRINIDKENHSKLSSLEGITRINDFGQEQEIRLNPGTNPQTILKDIINLMEVRKFEITTPSLRDIFIRIANPKEKEESHV